MKTEWDIESAIATYNVEGWGEGYFTVNSSGNVEARPLKDDGGSIDLLEVVNEARARNLSFPLLIRFQDLLRHRVESINRAFHAAISEFGYQNQYRGVFPIKVNQLREVVEEIVDAGESGDLPQDEAGATAIAYACVRQGSVSLSDLKRQIERDCVARALAETHGNITKAAALLGMKRPRLSQLVKQYGLTAVSTDGSQS